MATLVAAAEPIVSSQFKAKLAQDGQSAILTHRYADGKTRSWRVEILGGERTMRLDKDGADAIAQLFNESKELQDPLLQRRGSKDPLIISTQKSPDASIGWQWSIPTSDGKSPTWSTFEADVKSQDIFTKLFVNVGTHHPEASQKSAHEPSAATELPSRTPDPKGIPNLGNTCFMNAALQGLLRMPGIGEYLQQDLGLAKGSDERHLQTALTSLFDEFEKEKPNSETIKQAATKIRNLPSIAKSSSPYGKYVFTIPDQHDSFEFLQRIKEMLKLDNAPKYCIKTQNFGVGSEEGSGVEGTSSPSPIADPEPSCCVTLTGGHLENPKTKLEIDTLLLQNMSEHEEPDAERVEVKVQQTKFTHDNLKELQHLSFLLPRFGTDDQKHQGAVTSIFSKNLMVPISKSIDQSDEPTIVPFQADSVICHEGRNRHSGHYVTIVRKGKGFQQISDEGITTLTPDQAEEMASKNGYIVNYNKLPVATED
ncbi:MAG: hypothetical protein NT065_07035 [Chlamydiae bacterium]|nr:hypothetical protein [Chlamydiota bacterium]